METDMVTLKNVAEQAGVSITTASFVLNGRGREMKISQPCSKRVMEAAQELGYRKNFLARALSIGKPMTIGLVMRASLDNRMWGPIAQGVEDGIQKYNKDLLLISTERDGKSPFQRGLEYLQDRRLDGLIVTSHLPMEEIPEHLIRTHLPIVSINGPANPDFPTIHIDPASGIREAIQHLRELGHTNILYIYKGKNLHQTRKGRVPAFRKAASEESVNGRVLFLDSENTYHKEISHHIEFNIGQLREKLDLQNATAVICYNDTLALSLYNVLAERGLNIPGDISVIGFDDLHSGHAIPAMTSISHMFREMGVKAVETVEQLTDNGKELRGKEIRIPSELVIRNSTGTASHSH